MHEPEPCISGPKVGARLSGEEVYNGVGASERAPACRLLRRSINHTIQGKFPQGSMLVARGLQGPNVYSPAGRLSKVEPVSIDLGRVCTSM